VGASARAGAEDVTRARADLLAALGRQRYDWIVELRGDEWTASALIRQVRPVRRFDRGSVRIADWLRGRGGRRSAGGPDVMHEIETNLRVVAGESWTTARLETEPPLFPGASEALRDAVRRLAPALDVGAPYVVLQLGASWAPRAWSAERFGAVAARLRAAYHASIVVLGTADDASLESAFVSGGGPSDAAFFFGTLSLPEVGELLRHARLFVASDGGLAHLAGAYGTPTLALFGPQNPARFGPRGRRVIILHHPVACYPCAQTICVRPEQPCVNLISVEEASSAAAALWSAAGDPRGTAGAAHAPPAAP
jgi:ADP-heptose:LPS heptosyltransferase